MYLNKSMENTCEGNGLTTYIPIMNNAPRDYGLLMGTHMYIKSCSLILLLVIGSHTLLALLLDVFVRCFVFNITIQCLHLNVMHLQIQSNIEHNKMDFCA